MAEEVLLDSQCGCRRGRGCVDMIFGARQMIEKAIEHHTKHQDLVDLRKAYDSVPCRALWCALEKYGIPMAEVTVDGQVAPESMV